MEYFLEGFPSLRHWFIKTKETNPYSILLISGQSWCQLAYWEECQRVGHLIPVSSSSIEIFSALPKSKDGLCLKSLFKENKRPSESTTRTREKIGQGTYIKMNPAYVI